MDIRQLRYFLAIAKEGQITRAAKKLNMEQPPLSRQLKLIEEELGVTLFDRDGRQMKLTEAGMIFQVKAEGIIHQLNETITEMKDIDQGIQGMLSIGSVFTCVSLLPEKIASFREHYPRITFKILEGDHSILGEYLENRNIELVVTRLPFESNYDSNRYSILPLPSDPFVLVVPKKQDWRPAQSSFLLEDLADIPIIALKSDKTIQLHEKIVNECRRLGFEPNIICECSSVAITMALVAEGIGATIFPKSVLSSFQIPDIELFDMPDITVQSDVGIVWLKNRYLSKSAKHFIELFGQQVDDSLLP
ncbi:MAG: LysR family transcriptional regulator [Bacillus sp. (in: firmicutes)]